MQESRPNQRGFTLVEVMIAILIFGVGLLAVASLQGVARKASYEAVQRTTATHLAESLLERMRANPRGLGTYVASAVVWQGAAPGGDPAACTTTATACSPAGMAAADLAQWWDLVEGSTETVDGAPVGGLVQPTVCLRSTTGGITGAYTVAIAWRGASEVDQTGADPCGAAGTHDYGNFRRVIVLNSYINAL
jgi:type IV pilus assembly protein PilV